MAKPEIVLGQVSADADPRSGDERDRRVHTPGERGSTGPQPIYRIVRKGSDRAIRDVLLGHGARVRDAHVRTELFYDGLFTVPAHSTYTHCADNPAATDVH